MKTYANIMMMLIRSEVFGIPCDISPEDIGQEALERLYELSNAHDLAHIVASALLKRGMLGKDEVSEKFKKQHMLALYRTEGMIYELERVKALLEDEKIPYIPLKGAVIRELYPEPWMRTSSDIDIFVCEKDLESAADKICEKFQYRRSRKGACDISMHSPGGVHVELHYDLINERSFSRACDVLENVWKSASASDGSYCYTMSDEMFYFYFIVHMAKHFENGGCGIRPFIDLCILGRENEDKRSELLERAGLDRFESVARKLAEYWFFGGEADELTLQMEEYVLVGGVYGTTSNRVAVHQQKSGGALRYALSKIFLSYDILKFHYPIIQKYPVLTPIMEVRRWFKLVFCGHLKRTTNELRYNGSIDKTDADHTKQFLQDIGLIK